MGTLTARLSEHDFGLNCRKVQICKHFIALSLVLIRDWSVERIMSHRENSKRKKENSRNDPIREGVQLKFTHCQMSQSLRREWQSILEEGL